MSIEKLACLYVSLHRHDPIPEAYLEWYKQNIEQQIVAANPCTDTEMKQHVLNFKIWCLIENRLRPCNPTTLQAVHARSAGITPSMVAALVCTKHSTAAPCTLGNFITSVDNSAGHILCKSGIQLCMGWLHMMLMQVQLMTHYYTHKLVLPPASKAVTRRMCKLLGNLYISRCQYVYDECFLTRMKLLLNIQERLAWKPSDSIFWALEAYHNPEVNAAYKKIQESDNYAIVENIDNCNTIHWGIIAIFVIADTIKLYDQRTIDVLRDGVATSDSNEPFLWLDLNHKRMYTTDGHTSDSLDTLILYFLQTYLADTIIARTVITPELVDHDHPIHGFLQY